MSCLLPAIVGNIFAQQASRLPIRFLRPRLEARMKTLRLLLLLTTSLSGLLFAQTYNLPFQHIIVVVQENRTTDNLFANDPGLATTVHFSTSGLCGTQTITLAPYQLDAC